MAPARAVETGIRPSIASMTRRLITLPSIALGVTRCTTGIVVTALLKPSPMPSTTSRTTPTRKTQVIDARSAITTPKPAKRPMIRPEKRREEGRRAVPATTMPARLPRP